MRTGHTYPTYVRLVDGSHVPVVLILDPGARGILAATVAEPPRRCMNGCASSSAASAFPTPSSTGTAPPSRACSSPSTRPSRRRGTGNDTDAQVAGDDLVWCVTEGGRIGKAVQRVTQHTVHDVAAALHDQRTQTQGDRA